VKTVLVDVPDLMFETRIVDAARAMGCSVVTSADKIDDSSLLIVGLENNPGWLSVVERARSHTVPVLAFGRHTSAALLRQAREAGCTQVVVNSDIADRLPKLLEEMLD
jgi:hypothetical protein